MASMMGPSNVGSASGFTSPNAPKRPPQIQTQTMGAPQGGQQPTFGQMQQQGQPRPAPPQDWYNYTPGSTQQRPQQPTMSTGGFNPGSLAGGAGYAPGSGYRPPSQFPPPGAAQPQRPPTAQPWQPPNPTQLVNGVTQNPMVQWGQRVAGFPQTPIMPPAPPQAAPQTPQTPPAGTNVPPGAAQYGSNPAATSDQQNAANQLGSATQSLLLNQLQNPDPLAAQAFQTQMQNAQTGINENMQQQSDAINSNLASRGVYDSSLAGGYLHDLSTSAGRQMASIGANLLPQEAALSLQGTNSALANALGYNQNQFGQQLGTAQFNLQQQLAQNQQLSQLLGLTQT